ncbi:MAG TPA: putative quinol monooxygenase [Acidimicrobiales bacterium]
MILIVVKQPVRAKYADEFPALMDDFVQATRAEPGNISFELFRSAEDPNLWAIVEVFKDADAGTAHVESDHFKAAVEKMPNWLSAAPQIIHAGDLPGEGWGAMNEAS